jgi:hypothetical protein
MTLASLPLLSSSGYLLPTLDEGALLGVQEGSVLWI